MSLRSNITMAGLAELAGVSISTVSRALANNPAIALSTREQIKALATEHGFAPNPMARGLRRQRTDTVGVVIPLGHQRDQHLTDPFIMTMIGHIADALAEQGYDMLLRRILPDNDGWLDGLARSGRVDGLIVLGQSDQHEVLNQVAANYSTLVVWGAHLADNAYPTIGSDNRLGGRLAARHLYSQGRRRLLFLGHSDAPEFALREQGFREECGSYPDVQTKYISVGLIPEAARQQLTGQLADHNRVDGIFAVSDVIALAAIDVLEQAGRSVPDDVSIIGYDNVTLSAYGTRPLTTIDQHLEQGARELVDTLRNAIDGKVVDSVVLDPTLIVRSTSNGTVNA